MIAVRCLVAIKGSLVVALAWPAVLIIGVVLVFAAGSSLEGTDRGGEKSEGE